MQLSNPTHVDMYDIGMISTGYFMAKWIINPNVSDVTD